MQDTIKAGSILIKEGTLLPEAAYLESEHCVPGWRLVKNFDRYELDREIQKTGWTFFCLAGEIRASVFGIDEPSMVRRAIEHILARPNSEKFNSLEITRVASVGSGRFPLVRYITVFAQSRHIQESLFLFSAERIQEPGRPKLTATRTKALGLTNANGLAPEGSNVRADVAATPTL